MEGQPDAAQAVGAKKDSGHQLSHDRRNLDFGEEDAEEAGHQQNNANLYGQKRDLL
jgi:hypothetical protein